MAMLPLEFFNRIHFDSIYSQMVVSLFIEKVCYEQSLNERIPVISSNVSTPILHMSTLKS